MALLPLRSNNGECTPRLGGVPGANVIEPVAVRGAQPESVHHYLTDYERARRKFRWEAARQKLLGAATASGQLNMAHEALDRQIERGAGNKLALRIIDRQWNRADLTYRQLQSQCNRFANVLRTLEVEPGACVTTLLGRAPELFSVALGALKAGNLYCSLFSAFGPEPLKTRLQLGHARVLVTTAMLYKRKAAQIRAQLPELQHVLIVRDDPLSPLPADTLDLSVLMAAATDTCAPAPTREDQPALLHFTSGTTGKPKGVTLNHGAVIAQHATAQLALDLHPDDIYLVHCRSRLGHGYRLRRYRSTQLRRHADRRSRGIRSPALVPDSLGGARQRVVHGTNRHPHADEGGHRARTGPDLSGPAFTQRASENRSMPRRCSGGGGLWHALPRHLVADRDRRDHDRQLRRR